MSDFFSDKNKKLTKKDLWKKEALDKALNEQKREEFKRIFDLLLNCRSIRRAEGDESPDSFYLMCEVSTLPKQAEQESESALLFSDVTVADDGFMLSSALDAALNTVHSQDETCETDTSRDEQLEQIVGRAVNIVGLLKKINLGDETLCTHLSMVEEKMRQLIDLLFDAFKEFFLENKKAGSSDQGAGLENRDSLWSVDEDANTDDDEDDDWDYDDFEEGDVAIDEFVHGAGAEFSFDDYNQGRYANDLESSLFNYSLHDDVHPFEEYDEDYSDNSLSGSEDDDSDIDIYNDSDDCDDLYGDDEDAPIELALVELRQAVEELQSTIELAARILELNTILGSAASNSKTVPPPTNDDSI